MTISDTAQEVATRGGAQPQHLYRLFGADRPRIVCLCGSTKFKAEFIEWNSKLTIAGEIVLSVGMFGHADFPDEDWFAKHAKTKTRLDELHKRKIDLADYIFVLNVGGYIGESTASEIAYAQSIGRTVQYLHQP
jgi:hypothetical protein